jgi:hypothetical protein
MERAMVPISAAHLRWARSLSPAETRARFQQHRASPQAEPGPIIPAAGRNPTSNASAIPRTVRAAVGAFR